MANTTRDDLTDMLSDKIGDYEERTVTGQGNAGGTTFIDTGLAELVGGDDGIEGLWVEWNGGDNDNEVGRITTYDATTVPGTVTVASAFTNQVDSADTYLLQQWRPRDKHRAINLAIRALSDVLYLPITDETTLIDNLLTDTGLVVVSGAVTGWTDVGTPTLAEETSQARHGRTSLSITASGAEEGIKLQVYPDRLNINGNTITLECDVYSDTADEARLKLDFGVSSNNGDYHDGDDEWTTISVSTTVPTGATEVTAQLLVANGGVAYFTRPNLFIDGVNVYRYQVPSSIVHGPHRVTMQSNDSNIHGVYLPVGSGTLAQGRILRMEGMGRLSEPSTGTGLTGTVEVDGARANLIAAQAKVELGRMLNSRTRTRNYDDWITDGEREVDMLKATPGVRMRPMSAQFPRAWGTSSNSTSTSSANEAEKWVVFDRERDTVVETQQVVA